MTFDKSLNPQCAAEELAMLYLKNQSLADKTPVQLHEMYLKAYYEIRNDYIQKLRNGYFAEQNR